MLYLLKDKAFFNEVIKVLKEKAIYNKEVWQYALYHKDDINLMSEYFEMVGYNAFTALGTFFDSKLVTINQNNAASGFTKHLEYHPMVNNRVHKVGKEGANDILNETFRKTYNEFLISLL